MNVAFKIALRYIFPRKSFNFISIITIISIIGITIGVAALIIVMSIFNGFRQISEEMILKFDPAIRIICKNSLYIDAKDYTNIIQKISSAQNISANCIQSISPTLETKAVLVNKDKIEVVDLISTSLPQPIQTSYSTNYVFDFNKESLVLGVAPNDNNDILLGIVLTERLKATITDTMQLLSMNALKTAINMLQIPTGTNVVLNGIFIADIKEYDLTRAYAKYEIVRRICDNNISKKFYNPISYIDIFAKTTDAAILNTLAKEIAAILPSNFTLQTWQELNIDLYNVMQMERVAVFCILSLILLIAIFNVFASLAMSVMQRKQAIQILKAIGANDNTVSKIYFYEGILIGSIGTVIGLLVGTGFVLGQTYFHWFKLDAMAYVVADLPMRANWTEVLIVCAFSLLLSVLAGVFPAKAAVRSLKEIRLNNE